MKCLPIKECGHPCPCHNDKVEVGNIPKGSLAQCTRLNRLVAVLGTSEWIKQYAGDFPTDCPLTDYNV